MDINIKKIRIDSKIYDVTSQEKYCSNPEKYDSNYTAIESEGLAYPLINKTDYYNGVPGVLDAGLVMFYNQPAPNNPMIDQYNMQNAIDFSNAKSMKTIIEKSNMVKSLENEILVNSDNITVIKSDDNDDAEMAALKEAINCKQCDINAYSTRFNGNLLNDIRILKGHSITLSKLKTYGNALDMKMTLTIEDQNPDVPNPIGKSISVEITGGDS